MKWELVDEKSERGEEYGIYKSPFGFQIEKTHESMKLLLEAPDVNVENYYSREMDESYVSVSQYKSFMGKKMGESGCEMAALAEMRREFVRPTTTAMLVGQYCDSYFEGTLPTFMAQHPEIISSRGKTQGELKSEYKQASDMVDRAEKDEMFMKYMNGNKQVIMTGEIMGIPFKIKIDSEDGNRITDLKTCQTLNPDNEHGFFIYDNRTREKYTFIEGWGYDLQLAAYREIYRQNTGKTVPCFICAISKDKTDNISHPRIEIIEIPPQRMDERLIEIQSNIRHIQSLKTGEMEPIACGTCDYCADTLPLIRPISLDELEIGVHGV